MLSLRWHLPSVASAVCLVDWFLGLPIPSALTVSFQKQGGQVKLPTARSSCSSGPGTVAKTGCRGQLEQRSSEGSLCGDCKEAGPSRYPGGDRGRSQVRGDGGGAALSCRTVEPAASPGAEDEKAASLVAAEFGVSAVTLAPGSSIDRAAWQGVCAGWASPRRVRVDTIVASRASWNPCHQGRPLATISMRRSSGTGTSRFISASRTLRGILALPSRQTRATACSRGSARRQHPRSSTRGTVITQHVELPMARASVRRKRQGHAQAPQQEDAEQGARDRHFVRLPFAVVNLWKWYSMQVVPSAV